MIPNQQNIESLTGLLAVGSLGMLGIFLIIDGQTNIFVIFEEYGKSTSWGIFAAVPMLVLSYLLGLFLSQIAEILFTKIAHLNSANEEQQFISIARSGNEYVINRYSELTRQKRLLESASIAFLLLSLGTLSEVKQMYGWEIVAYGSSVGALVVAVISPLMAIRVSRKIENLISALSEIKDDQLECGDVA